MEGHCRGASSVLILSNWAFSDEFEIVDIEGCKLRKAFSVIVVISSHCVDGIVRGS